MIMKTKELTVPESNTIGDLLPKRTDILFFDIETTGFSAHSTNVYLIGCACYDGTAFQIRQWFSQSESDEKEILCQFFQFIQPYRTLVHYNGEGFDMPYLIQRCRFHQLPYDFTLFQSIDLYKQIAPYKDILHLPNLKQKTMEAFLGISREDIHHGGELISVYDQYQKTQKSESLHTLLLHNHDDLSGIVLLYPLTAYYALFHGRIENASCAIHTYTSAAGEHKTEAIFSFTCTEAIPKEFSYRSGAYYLFCSEKTGKLSVQIYEKELKYFFSNYKDYYYLPAEDISIHKSVAFCVDKDFRTQATPANCYNKKSGQFLPQHTELFVPYFKQKYHDRQTYFELTEEFRQNPEQILLYVKHLLVSLTQKNFLQNK